MIVGGALPGRPPLLQESRRGLASKKHKRMIKAAKGYRGRANRIYSAAVNRVEKAWQYAYRDRRVKRRLWRRLWITRLNAALRQYGLAYSRFVPLLSPSGGKIPLNRKVLSGLAMHEPFSFRAVLHVALLLREEEEEEAKAEAEDYDDDDDDDDAKREEKGETTAAATAATGKRKEEEEGRQE